jgi:phage terminase small subunit
MSKENKLTAKQQKFVDEYLIDLNATQAAIRAGYSDKTAQEQGSRLLSNVMVQAEIEAKRKRLEVKTEITAEKVLQEYAKIAFSNIGEFVDWNNGGIILKPSEELTKDQLACVSEVSESKTKFDTTVKFKLHDKLNALQKLGDHLGIFKKIVEMSGKDGGAIKVESSEVDLSGLSPEELMLFRELTAKIAAKKDSSESKIVL